MGIRRGPFVLSSVLGILLISGGHERAHYAFMMAAGAGAMLFAVGPQLLNTLAGP